MKNRQKTGRKELLLKIRSQISYNHFDSARNLIDEFIDKFGDDCYLELEIARYYREQNQIEEAKKILINLIEINSKNIGYVIYELGQLYEKQYDYDNAVKIYQTIDNVNHQNKSYVYLALANCYLRNCEYDMAEDYYNKIIKENVYRVSEAKYQLAKIKKIKKEYDNALEILSNILVGDNTILMCSVLLMKADIYKKQENIAEYSKTIDMILNIDSNYKPALVEKINICLKSGNTTDAKKTYESIKDKNFTAPRDLVVIGNYCEKINELELAQKMYSKVAIFRNSYYCFALFGLSRLAVKNGNLDLARDYLNDIIYIHDYHYNSAIIQAAELEVYNYNYNEAKKILTKIDENQPLMNQKELDRIKLIVDARLNNIDISSVEDEYGVFLVNYNEAAVIQHIRKYIKGFSKDKPNVFYENTDIKKLMIEVRKKLNEKCIEAVSTVVNYKIYYPNIGENNGQVLNYLTVITTLDSKNIISMYPVNEYGEEENIMNNEEPVKQKQIKRMSQIDKFNKKYNL